MLTNLYAWTIALLSYRPKVVKGQGLVEYSMIIGVVAVGAIVVMGVFGAQIAAIFTNITTKLNGIPAGTP